MDITEQFLRLVLPGGGFKFLAVPFRSGRGFAHTAFTDLEFMASHALEWAPQGHNVYFALGGFHQAEIVGVDGKKSYRTQDNVAFLRALWVDLDVKDGAYATQAEAIGDLVRFTRVAGLPIPTIVNSGGGVHAYWPLDQDVPRAAWKKLASMFKAVTVALGLKADPVRTADEASVLRVPGTVNMKPGRAPRPVAVVGQLTRPIPVLDMAAAVKRAFDASGASLPREAPSQVRVTGINADLMMEEQFEPADAGKIILRCRQVHGIASTHGDVPEPLWYAGLQLARHCDNGDVVAHDWSNGHPTYDEAATERKLQQLAVKNVGPTSCAKFDSANPGVCAGCPHYGEITSPIQLGRDAEIIPPAETPTLNLMGVEVELPDPPAPFTRTAAGQVVMAQLDEDGNPADPILVYRYDLYPVSRYFDEYERKYHTKFRTYQPKRGWYEFDVPNEVLYDMRAMAKCLANADVLPSMGAVKYLGDYLVSYTQKLQEMTEAANLFMQMGWREDDAKFVIGNRLVTADNVREIEASAISTKASEKFITKGDVDAWKEVVRHYMLPGNEGLLFGFLTAFGAPLFKLTGFNGAIINMMGPPGTGKSTVLKAMNSVYGTQDCAYFQLQDTEKSFYRRVGVLNNLPIGFDEITNIDAKRLSDLCYDFTQGRERMRLTSGAMERKDTFYWSTLMLSSSNASLHSRLSQSKSDAQAESVRVFEFTVSARPGTDVLETKRLFDRLNDNYGHVGAVYLQFVMQNMPRVKEMLSSLTERVYTEANLPSSERFWAAIVAANLTGGMMAEQLGIVSFDLDRMMKWSLARIQEMRGIVQEFKRTPSEMVSDWLAKLVPNTLVVAGKPEKPHTPAFCVLPKGELKARLDRTACTMYVSVDAIDSLCREYRIDRNQLKKELTGLGVLDRVDRKVLGAGTDFQTGQTSVWVLNMKSPLMADTSDEIAEAHDGNVVGFNRKGNTR